MIALAYHRIADDPRDPLAVPPRAFAAQLAWLGTAGILPAPPGTAGILPAPPGTAGILPAPPGTAGILPAPPGTAGILPARPGAQTLVLTFDDATLDFADHAWPCLQRHGYTAVLFVVPGRAGGRADWDSGSGAPLLDWPALRALQAAGVEIGAHGHTHGRLNPDDEDAAHAEWSAAREAITAQLGAPPQALAYPYGEWSPALAHAAARAGFTRAYTARSGRNTAATPLLKLRRALVTRRDGPLRFAVKVLTGYATLTDLRMDLRGVP